jgi:putative glutamine amidotransferase
MTHHVAAAPMIALVAHRRSMDTVLGEQEASIAYGGYLRNLDRAGAATVVLAPGARVPRAVLDHMDGLLLTGGGDIAGEHFDTTEKARDVDDERDELELALVRHCRERGIPVLGMCRGNQVLNVALGGTLRTVDGHVQDTPMDTPVQTVVVDAGCRLAKMLSTDRVEVNSYHRWSVETPADGLRVVARAADGTVEGIEWTASDWFAVGTQWHAELLDDPHVRGLFDAFVAAARQRSSR